MARIGVDATHVSNAGKGIGLTQEKAVEGLLGLGYDVVAFVRAPEAREILAPGVEVHRVRSPKTILWELVELPWVARRLSLDAVVTFSERLSLWGGPYVVWLFELPTHRIALNRKGAPRYQRAADSLTASLWRPGLRRAARIATGSRATADELALELPEVAARTSVVYPALRDGYGPGPGPQGEGRYVFHLSSDDPRDNTEAVLAAFALASPAGVRLVIGGGLGGRRGPLEAERDRLGLGAAVVFTGRLSDEDLLARYRGAAAYLDATLYEGFGYQVLEAMACGAPVVASTATSIPEVVGDAGLLCDPRAPAEIAAALSRILDDETLAGDLRVRGLARAATFSWEATARALAAEVEKALAA